ncbi:hypothetical protein N1I87_15070 [Bacillus sp. FSL W8-0102]|uniref:hypothetical protein n=1 Tax=Bacillus sp. FSL W8-0102 TaxID=2978205 RepID=UPI0030FB1320
MCYMVSTGNIKEYLVKSTEKDLKKYIGSEEYYSFEAKIKKDLDIQNVQTPYSICNKLTSFATLGKVYSLNDIKSVFFSTRKIAELLSTTFEVIIELEEIFEKVSKIMVHCILVHELIHVWQLKVGKLSKEIFERESLKPYCERSYEKEAFEKTNNIMKSLDPFTKAVVEIMMGEEKLDNQSLPGFTSLYFNEFKN